ncbi:recombination protein RecR [Candidatus Giovannonibacteria bacterium]|nr:recombination protein RecR [Candidatus Giovannonibacteria bacterium]
MATSIIIKLIEIFQKLPGIGPRQARRFVYALVDENPKIIEEFSDVLSRLSKEVSHCSVCFRIFEGKSEVCNICADKSRDNSKLLILEKDADLENLEKNKIFDGKYYVLGGLLSPLRPEKQDKLRFRELFKKVESSKEINEIIIGLSSTTEGDMTVRYIEKIIEPILAKRKLKISRLGRGLSTGTELEYSDRDTLKHAFENRK